MFLSKGESYVNIVIFDKLLFTFGSMCISAKSVHKTLFWAYCPKKSPLMSIIVLILTFADGQLI